jgi:hypothetical protein
MDDVVLLGSCGDESGHGDSDDSMDEFLLCAPLAAVRTVFISPAEGVRVSGVSVMSKNMSRDHPPSPTQNRLRHTTRMHQGSRKSHTAPTRTARHHVTNMSTTCRAARRTKTVVGMRLGIPGW